MKTNRWSFLKRLGDTGGIFLAVVVSAAVLLGVMATMMPVRAQGDHQVEILTGRIEPREIMVYTLPNLIEGDTLYVYATTLSGNLDPFVGIAEAGVDADALRDDFNLEVNQAIKKGRDPTEVIPEFANAVFLAWNDDQGTSYDAAAQWAIAPGGEYRLLLFPTPANIDSFGQYQLTVGINAPEVLTGRAEATGDTIAVLDREASHIYRAVEEAGGELTAEKSSTFLTLRDFDAGDTLYVFVEAVSGDLRPVLELRDYGDKLLRMGNASGKSQVATLQHTFSATSRDNRLVISSWVVSSGTPTSGEFRVLVGVNAPDVLSGSADPVGRAVIRQPIDISVGVRLEQIVGIDLKAQTIEVVASVQMDWVDQRLAFRPDECDCRTLILRGDSYTSYVAANADKWPEFSIFNQEGRRFAQNQYGLVGADGQATYYERFTVVIHDTSMDYAKYPFDSQEFSIVIDSLFPGEFYIYTPNEDFSQVGQELGEEEWVVTGFTTAVSTTPDFGSRFSFIFPATRHLSYYILRVFVPLGLIILVSWVTFFLKDYALRISLAGANLLLFVAFNFTLGGDLPKLGYVTLLDAVLMTMFLMTALVMFYNVALRTWERGGEGNRASRVDKFAAPVYLVLYGAAFATIALVFLL